MNRHAPRRVKLPVASAVRSPFSYERVTCVELLNAMIARISDVNVVGRINRDSFWSTELPVTSAAAAPAHDEAAGRSNHFNSMITELGNVNINGRVNRHAAGSIQELAI